MFILLLGDYKFSVVDYFSERSGAFAVSEDSLGMLMLRFTGFTGAYYC